MAKKKRELKELEKDGFKLVPETTGRIIDSIWINEETQVLKIKFASGGILCFQPLEPIKL
jgi:hypothetical protein